MRAMVLTRFGGPDVFESRDVEKPSPGHGQLLVRVHATSINPVDTKIRKAGAWARVRKKLEAWAARLLRVGRGQAEEEAVRRRLAKQRDHLFTFLDEEAVPATNNLAERQLRPAVIARKVSCGNRTWPGARAWETLASLAATCAQTGASFADLLQTRLCVSAPAPAR